MRCPFCSSEDTQVVDTRSNEGTNVIRRRRKCPKCDKRFTTYERVELRIAIALPPRIGWPLRHDAVEGFCCRVLRDGLQLRTRVVSGQSRAGAERERQDGHEGLRGHGADR